MRQVSIKADVRTSLAGIRMNPPGLGVEKWSIEMLECGFGEDRDTPTTHGSIISYLLHFNPHFGTGVINL